MATIISTKTSGVGGLQVTGDASGVLQLASNNGTTGAELDASQLFKFNSGYGSVATAYGCRAWVNFNGTGTVAIRASGNVTSITDNGTGNYTVNFTTAMPDANYSAIASGDYTGTDLNVARGAHVDNFATGSYRVSTGQTGTGTKEDFALVTTSVFR